MKHIRTWLTVAVISVVFAAPVLAGSPLKKLTLVDPAGDDNGPGKYVYPTDPVYTAKSFDLRKVEVIDKGATVEFRVTVGARIKDPWNSKDWDGNGCSLQFAQIYIDTDHKAGSGHTKALPGLNVSFDKASAWDKALIISPQGTKRLNTEIKAKARKFKKDIVLPVSVRVRGRSIVALFPKAKVGTPAKGWGYQALVQSNEGYPSRKDLLTRKVNEYKGKHKFGGGHDFECDPHVIDMLAGSGKGGGDEKAAQHKALKGFKCDDEDPEGGTWATIPMIYP